MSSSTLFYVVIGVLFLAGAAATLVVRGRHPGGWGTMSPRSMIAGAVEFALFGILGLAVGAQEEVTDGTASDVLTVVGAVAMVLALLAGVVFTVLFHRDRPRGRDGRAAPHP